MIKIKITDDCLINLKRNKMNKEKLKENCCTPEGQIKRYIDCKGCDRKPKQETLEEVAERYSNNFTGDEGKFAIEDFINGAKWQQERMYSENEVKGMLYQVGNAMRYKGINYAAYYNYKNVSEEVNKVLEQFKKK
jgi:hypothetical protein